MEISKFPLIGSTEEKAWQEQATLTVLAQAELTPLEKLPGSCVFCSKALEKTDPDKFTVAVLVPGKDETDKSVVGAMYLACDDCVPNTDEEHRRMDEMLRTIVNKELENPDKFFIVTVN